MKNNKQDIVVLKFGGTSLANAQRLFQVAEILEKKHQQHAVAVVLSAPAKVTNYLVSMVEKMAMQQSVEEEFHELKALLFNLLHDLAAIQPHFPLAELITFVNQKFNEIDKFFSGIQLLQQCPDNIHAKIIASGEQISIAMMAALLKVRGNAVTVIDPRTSLIAEGSYLEAIVDIPRSTDVLQQLNLSEHSILLMAGFTAGNSQGELMVLGRNGSDYSAAVLAACLHAKYCEIWTDVDGVYTCDPRLVPNARLLTSLSYQEAMELSYFGAKVLHPKTIVPIAQFKIPCVIKNTQNPMASGTIIGCKSEDQGYPVKGITNLNEMVMLNLSGPGMKGVIGMASRLFSALSRANISVVLITQASSEYSISFCLSTRYLTEACRALNVEFYLEIEAGLLDPLDIYQNLAIISVVGDGMRTATGISARLFTALSRGNINIVAIAQGSSERSISVVINQEQVVLALQACHQMLFDTDQVLDLFVIGTGGVGSAFINQIQRQQHKLKQKQIDLRVVGLANSKNMLIQTDGLNLNNWSHSLKESKTTMDLAMWLNLVKQQQLLNPVLIDCTADVHIAKQYPLFLRHGFHVVTSNKQANTDSMHYYQELRAVAQQYQRKFLYDTNVGAGLPVIENLQNLINAGDELLQFHGILSGSLSYIFGLLEDGITLSEATKRAKQQGYTEPDPRDDLSGKDVARKLLILAREAGYLLEMSDIVVESVIPSEFFDGELAVFWEKLPQLDEALNRRVLLAAQQGKVLRYVGQISKQCCQVKIVAVSNEDPLYKIRNGENALAFYTDYYQPIPLVLRGYGAGNEVTAAGIFADMLRTVANRMN